MANFSWSIYQQNMFNEFINTNKSFVVNAVAGSGKTSSALEMMRRYCEINTTPHSCLFMAFNKSIANENRDKVADMGLSQSIDVMTVHALGFKAIVKGIRKAIKSDEHKYRKYLRNAIFSLSSMITIDMDKTYINSAIINADTLYRLARLNLIQYNDINTLESIAKHHNVDCIADEINIVNNMLRTAYTYDNSGFIDFTDMLTLACTQFRRYVPKYGNVVIDEAQDLSKAQQMLMLASIEKGGRFVAVGDPWQAINGFAGAMNDSFSQLVDLAHGNELPLSVNYRCGSEIIKLAQSVYPTIQANPNAHKGEVKYVNDFSELQNSDYIICRKSAPIISLALKLIANGKSAYVLGKDILEGLQNLINRVNATTITSLYIKLDKEIEKKVKEMTAKGESDPYNCSAVQSIKDKVECIKVIGDTCLTIKDIENRLTTLFDDTKKGVSIKLSTIHKSKGLEADRVWIIVPQKLPLTYKGQKDWEYEQEMHLKYVAYTRAKNSLYICSLDEDGIAKYQF